MDVDFCKCKSTHADAEFLLSLTSRCIQVHLQRKGWNPPCCHFVPPLIHYHLYSTFVINSDKIYLSFCLLKLCALLISQLLDSYWVDQSLFPLKSEPLPWLVSPTSKQLKSLVDIDNKTFWKMSGKMKRLQKSPRWHKFETHVQWKTILVGNVLH